MPNLSKYNNKTGRRCHFELWALTNSTHIFTRVTPATLFDLAFIEDKSPLVFHSDGSVPKTQLVKVMCKRHWRPSWISDNKDSRSRKCYIIKMTSNVISLILKTPEPSTEHHSKPNN